MKLTLDTRSVHRGPTWQGAHVGEEEVLVVQVSRTTLGASRLFACLDSGSVTAVVDVVFVIAKKPALAVSASLSARKP